MAEKLFHNEQEVLMQVAAGDEKAFGRLFDAFHPKLRAFVFRLVNSSALTQDIIQEVFLKVWIHRSSLSEVKQFEAYLYIIARNHTFNYLRGLAREHRNKQKWEEYAQESLHDDPAEAATARYYNNLIEQAISHLPARQKKVYLLSRYGNLKNEEIADRLDISYETVKQHIKLALRAIRKYLSEHDGIPFLLILLLRGLIT